MQVADAKLSTEAGSPQKEIDNRDHCSICRKGGELLCCDHCPKSFHTKCLKIKPSELPENEWFCPKCL